MNKTRRLAAILSGICLILIIGLFVIQAARINLLENKLQELMAEYKLHVDVSDFAKRNILVRLEVLETHVDAIDEQLASLEDGWMTTVRVVAQMGDNLDGLVDIVFMLHGMGPWEE